MNSKRIFKWDGNKNTKKVVVPNGFTEIGRYAFKGAHHSQMLQFQIV